MLAFTLAMLFGALGAVAPAALAGPACVLAWRIARGPGRASALLLIALVIVQSWRAHRALAEREAQRSALLAHHAGIDRCEGLAEIRGSPVLRGGRFVSETSVVAARCERGPPFSVLAMLAFDAPHVRGDVITGAFDIGPKNELANGLLLERGQPLSRRRVLASGSLLVEDSVTPAPRWSPWALVDRARNRVRQRLMSRLSFPAQSLARALVLGESDLTPEVDTAFKQSGLAHLLAVSGMHLVVVCAAFAWLTQAVVRRVPRIVAVVPATRIATIVAAPVAIAYTDFTASSGSAVRAALMAACFALAVLGGRRGDATRSLCLAAAVLAALDPLAVFDVSFALSLAATASLIAWANMRRRDAADALLSHAARDAGAWWARPGVAVVRRVVGASLLASLACAPLLALLDAETSLLAPFENLVAIPVGELYALPLCLLVALVPDALLVGNALVATTEGALRALSWLAAVGARPWRVAFPYPHDFELGVLVCVAVAVIRVGLGWRTRARLFSYLGLGAAALVGDELCVRAARSASTALRITHFDVAQGDAALLELPHGHAVLIDAGGLVGSTLDIGRTVIRPALRSRRITRLDVVVLSHPHPDHYGGLTQGLRGIAVGEVWDSGLTLADDAARASPAATWVRDAVANGATLRTAPELCSKPWFFGEPPRAARVRVAGPCPNFDAARSTNDNSLVVHIAFGASTFLFSGDAERAEESFLLGDNASLAATVLKVGHHGSRTSSSDAWLARVRPSWAVISAGARNRFGHPAPVTLAALAAAGTHVFRTDRDGAIKLLADEFTLRAETMRDVDVSDAEAHAALPWDRTPERARRRDHPPRSQSAFENAP